MLDAGVDAEIDAARPPCSETPPAVFCTDVSASEALGSAPGGPTVLRLEVTETKLTACDGPWTIRRCARTETYWSSSGDERTTTDETCETLTVRPGGIVRCSERETYEVAGNLRWERTITWDVATVATSRVP